MSFTLKVRFSGLCLFVPHTDGKRVGVLLPDARKSEGVDPVQDDGSRGDHHAAYLRFDLANLDETAFPPQDPEDPDFEGIYRLDRESVEFGVAAEDMDLNLGSLVKFEKIAPQLTLKDNLFRRTPPPPKVVGARIIIRGGELRAKPGPRTWVFSKQLSGGDDNVKGAFSGVSDWVRTVSGAELPIKIKSLQDPTASARTITLKPVGGEVCVKIGNLSRVNPLEWPQLESHHDSHRMEDLSDPDFKWLYRLFKPSDPNVPLSDLLHGCSLPIPEVPCDAKPAGNEQCINGGTGGTSFDDNGP